MVIVPHESYDSVLVGTGKQIGLESLSENREWRRRCDVERQFQTVAPETRSNVIEVNHWAKVANKTANINVQNRSLYAS